jgi:hypothetical protein
MASWAGDIFWTLPDKLFTSLSFPTWGVCQVEEVGRGRGTGPTFLAINYAMIFCVRITVNGSFNNNNDDPAPQNLLFVCSKTL